MIEFDEGEDADEGAPAWMATFADLMSLLVCFFVLLLSFSEMDVTRYKEIASSLKEAFGVQSRIEAQSIPRGTSVVAREFSPGTPQPTPRPIINQQTDDETRPMLEVGTPGSADGEQRDETDSVSQELMREMLREMLSSASDEEILRSTLKDGITEGKIEVVASLNQITVRIREKGAFESGSAVLNPDFKPLIEQLKLALKEIEGTISVEGHTDNVPIQSQEFDSNWDLSVGRALSVAKELMNDDYLDQTRFVVGGHADTKPFRPNDSPENRAENRRVELVIRGGVPDSEESELSVINPQASAF